MNNRDYYVYVYSDPDTNRPFYVGKGRGSRVKAHLKYKRAETDKQKMIDRFVSQGRKPAMQIVQWAMSEDEAFAAEATLIQFLGLGSISNRVCGRGCRKVHADFLEFIKDKKPLPERKRGGRQVLVVSANGVYRPGMSRFELYDAVRGNLRVNPERVAECDMALILLDGFVIDVYQGLDCTEAGAEARMFDGVGKSGGYDIVGRFASEVMKNRYVGREWMGSSPSFYHIAYARI